MGQENWTLFMLQLERPMPDRVRVLVYTAPQYVVNMAEHLRRTGIQCRQQGKAALRVDQPRSVMALIQRTVPPDLAPDLVRAAMEYEAAWTPGGKGRRLEPTVHQARVVAAAMLVGAMPRPGSPTRPRGCGA